MNCPNCSTRSKSAGTETTPLKNFARPFPPTPWTALEAGGSQMRNAQTDPTALWPESLRYLSTKFTDSSVSGILWVNVTSVTLCTKCTCRNVAWGTGKPETGLYLPCLSRRGQRRLEWCHLSTQYSFVWGKKPVFVQNYFHNMSPISRSHPAAFFTLNLPAGETSLVQFKYNNTLVLSAFAAAQDIFFFFFPSFTS